MSRAPHPRAARAAPVATAAAAPVEPDRKVAPDAAGEEPRPGAPASDPASAPAVPATEPLPSDQVSAPREAVPALAALDAIAAAPVETAPLPAPAPVPEQTQPAAAAFEPVPGTEPLPSDQLTPVRKVVVEVGNQTAFTDGAFEAGAIEVGARPQPAASDRDVLDLLRRDLDEAGFGLVILQADTVDLLRREFDLPPIDGERGLAAASGREDGTEGERRSFKVEYDVDHDGQSVAPGGRVLVDRPTFERLRRSTAIRADTDWWDGRTP